MMVLVIKRFRVARQFASKNVSIVTQENQGGSISEKSGVRALLRANIIQWLDADDLLSPDKITRQMEAVVEMADKRVLFSCPWGYFIYRPHRA